VGCVADLPVLLAPRHLGLSPLNPVVSIPFRSLFSINFTEQNKTGTGKKPYLPSTCACVATTNSKKPTATQTRISPIWSSTACVKRRNGNLWFA